MKVSVITKRMAITILFALLLGSPLFAQISIEWQEIPHVIGTHWTKNMAYDVNVNLGTAGGPQTWIFTTQPMGTDSCPNIVSAVNQAPFHDSFPNANLVYASITDTDSAFLYMQLESNFLSTLGLAGATSSGVCMIYDPADTNNLPENFNDTRHYYMSYTIDAGGGSYVIAEKRGFEQINGYGTVVIPYGSYPCLRFVLFDTLIQTFYYNNVPVYFDTTTSILHQFVAENYSGVVCVKSYAGETNPYFTEAAILERLTYFATGIEELVNQVAEERQVTIYPNPFSTRINFTLGSETREPIVLEIFDAQGKLVWTFKTSAGEKAAINWSGKNACGVYVADGVYFYRVRFDNQQMTGKFVKVR